MAWSLCWYFVVDVIGYHLNQMADQLFALSWEEVNDRHFHQGVAAWLLAHGGAGRANEHLAGEGGVVDLHVEREELVLRLSAHALSREMNAVSHVNHVVNTWHLNHVSLVVNEIGIGLDGGSHLLKVVTRFHFDVDHAAVDAFASRDGHRKGSLHTLNGLYGNGDTMLFTILSLALYVVISMRRG